MQIMKPHHAVKKHQHTHPKKLGGSSRTRRDPSGRIFSRVASKCGANVLRKLDDEQSRPEHLMSTARLSIGNAHTISGTQLDAVILGPDVGALHSAVYQRDIAPHQGRDRMLRQVITYIANAIHKDGRWSPPTFFFPS